MPDTVQSENFSYRFLQDIARDLSQKDLKFPTFIEASLRVRMALSRKELGTNELAKVVRSEPLLSARVVALSNSVALRPSEKPVTDLKNALMIVGHNAVRSLAVSLAMDQIAHAKDLRPFAAQSRRLWEHSLEVAALAWVLARQRGTIDPDEALFAGLVHDLGHFYLMWRATRFPELVQRGDELRELVHEWHPGIGAALLQNLNLSDALVRAVDEHELAPENLTPGSLAELLSVADRCSKSSGIAPPPDAARTEAPDLSAEGLNEEAARAILAEAAEDVRSLVAMLKGK
jgi:putative nucleotidyltransferase with HDIG domain